MTKRLIEFNVKALHTLRERESKMMNSTMNTFSQTNSPNRITPGRSEAAMPVKRIIFNCNHLNSYSKSSYSKKRIINRKLLSETENVLSCSDNIENSDTRMTKSIGKIYKLGYSYRR